MLALKNTSALTDCSIKTENGNDIAVSAGIDLLGQARDQTIVSVENQFIHPNYEQIGDDIGMY